jgi:subtilisin family serine protease
MKKLTLLFVITIGVVISANFLLTSKAQTEDKTPPVLSQTEIKSDLQQKIETFDALIDKARTEGSVRVIVGLNAANYKSEGELNFREKKAQREVIKSAQENFEKRLAEFDLKFIKFKYMPYILTTVKTDALTFMKNSPEVAGIAEDITFEPFLSESNEVIGNVPYALNAGLTGSGQTIVIIDSGVDKNHPFFLNQFFLSRVVKEACFSGYNGVSTFPLCNGGLVPPTLPEIHFPPSMIVNSTASGSGLPKCLIPFNGFLYPIGQCDHGTHVAGIAAGNSGVASEANIIAINIFSAQLNQQTGTFRGTYYSSSLLLALEHVYTLSETTNYKIAAVNMSLGYEIPGGFSSICDNYSPVERSQKIAIDNLRSKGIAVIAATGNTNFPNSTGSPACISTVISVGSTGDGSTVFYPNGTSDTALRDQVYTCPACSDGSNSASFVDLLAPGRWINSSVPGGSYAIFSGTSMAAPHVAGAWAILKQRNPDVTVDRALQTLRDTGKLIRDPRISFPLPPRDIPRIQVNNAAAFIGASCFNYQINIGQTINGQTLSNSDCSLVENLNWHYDYYEFNGAAGQQIAISMNSSAFNTYLTLQAPNGQIIEDDNGGGGTNSRLPQTSGFITLPVTGIYRLFAISKAPNLFGAYTLTITQVANVQVTFQTIPTGRSFTVDGTTYNSPQTFSWQSGSSHTIATTSPQGNNSTRYNWSNWSDGGAISHTVAPTSNITYTANFATQHFLTMNAGTGGTVSPASGWYNTGQPVQISAVPNNGFNFSDWTGTGGGSYTGSNNPATVTMDNPVNQTANFSSIPACTYTISPPNRSFNSSGGTGSFTVTAPNGCAWTITANSSLLDELIGNYESKFSMFGLTSASWLTITSGGGGSGNGTVNYSVPQYVGQFRTGTITLSANGQTRAVHTVNQSTRPSFDFDGDGKTDISIFRPALGQWWYLRSSDGSNRAFQFGSSTDKLVPADYTGDGKTDIAFWRPSTNQWFVLRSEDNSFYSFPFGAAGDVPAPADYDGDGKADAAVFRASNTTWYINRSSGGTTIQQFGVAGDVPAVADYDGDGKTDIAIYRPSLGQWWLLRSNLGTIAFQFGASTDKPVQGDYTGDGKADVAFFRPSTREWFILRSENNSFYAFPFGASGDIPAPGDYDGDGKFDAAVFRPSGLTWYVNRSSSTVSIAVFGATGDVPVPSAFVP